MLRIWDWRVRIHIIGAWWSVHFWGSLYSVSMVVCASAQTPIIIEPARVFDGDSMHEGWAVRVVGNRIEAAGPAASVTTAGARVIKLPGATLIPGLVEGHSHILLHPYKRNAVDRSGSEGGDCAARRPRGESSCARR